MSRLQKHFQKMYGRPRQEERDLGRLAEQVYADERMDFLMRPDGDVVYLFHEQYSALEKFCTQFDKTPKNMLEDVRNSIVVSEGYVTEIITPLGYRAKNGRLAIPKALTKIKSLTFRRNRLSSLTIPDTLTQLAYLDCSSNNLSSLPIHDTWTQLQTLICHENRLSSLPIPDTLKQLKEISCTSNQLPVLAIPYALTQLRTLYCGSNSFSYLGIPDTLTQLTTLACGGDRLVSLDIPQSVPLKTFYCTRTGIPESTKQKLRDRGVKVVE